MAPICSITAVSDLNSLHFNHFDVSTALCPTLKEQLSKRVFNGCDEDEDNDDDDGDDDINDGGDHSGCTDADKRFSFALIYNASSGHTVVVHQHAFLGLHISYHTLSDFIFFVHPLIPNYKL